MQRPMHIMMNIIVDLDSVSFFIEIISKIDRD